MQPLNIPITDQTKLFDATKLKLGPNVAEGVFSQPKLQNEIWQFMLKEYIYPQLLARRPYEKLWDVLYDLYRMRLKINALTAKEDETKFIQTLLDRAATQGNQDVVITDSLIFDTVNSLSNLAHYISWKDGKPVQFGSPEDVVNPLRDMFYSPEKDKYKSTNATLSWALNKEDCLRKSREGYRDYFLYGFGYVFSDLYFRAEANPDGSVLLRDIGMSYVPLSVRKVFIDWRIPIENMKDQPCPFWFDICNTANIFANPYDPVLNPMGFQNMEKLLDIPQFSTWFQGGEAWLSAVNSRLESMGMSITADISSYTKVMAKWTFVPQLPFDSKTGEFLVRADGVTPVPYRRFILQAYGANVLSGETVFLRLQDVQDHYDEMLPIYGGTHLGDLSSAAYSMSICETVIQAASQITELMNHAIENKKQINQSPAWIVVGSPAENSDVNKANEKIPVLSPNDFGWKPTIDATQTTMQMCDGLRYNAQKTTKVTESILGQALGGRTTATEADNLFETSMSQIATDITLLNKAYHGGFGDRVWKMYGEWLDPDLTKLITGQYGFPLSAEDLQLRISLRTDVGSRFLTSKFKQGILREFIQLAMQSPYLDQAILLEEYTNEVGLPGIQRAIVDGGRQRQIEIAKVQTMSIYMNENSIINPQQDHGIAIEVKTRYLEDVGSEWNVRYGDQQYMMLQWPNGMPVTRKQALAQQIQIHQNYQLQQQMQQQALIAQQAASVIQAQSAEAEANRPKPKQAA